MGLPAKLCKDFVNRVLVCGLWTIVVALLLVSGMIARVRRLVFVTAICKCTDLFC